MRPGTWTSIGSASMRPADDGLSFCRAGVQQLDAISSFLEGDQCGRFMQAFRIDR